MPRKFTIGLGDVSRALTSTQDGIQTRIFTGSIADANAVNSTTGLGTLVGSIATDLEEFETVSSQDSAPAYHSTLFEDFDVQAQATYNFYTSDEQTNTGLDESAKLSDLPRYVRVTWDAVPQVRVFETSTKGVRPSDPRTPPTRPVLSVSDAKGSLANGYVSPGVITALVVPPVQVTRTGSFSEDMFLSVPASAGGHAVDAAGRSAFHTVTMDDPEVRLRVNFVDPSIAGALDPNRVAVSQDHTHLASLGAFAKLAGGLEVLSEFNQDVPLRNPPPSFPAPTQTPSVLYIGYVLERYTLDQSGSMTLSRTIDIDDPTTAEFIDRQVVYGGRYVYRIRSLAQWSRPTSIGFVGASSLIRDPVLDLTVSRPTQRASFYSGQWSDWARTSVVDLVPPDPPGEITVRPVSRRRQVHIAWKMPEDGRRDIASLRLVRSTVSSGRYSDWKLLGEFVPGNGLYVDSDVVPHEQSHLRYMYAMYSVSYHGVLSSLSEKIEARITQNPGPYGDLPVRQIGPAGDDPTAHAAGPRAPVETEVLASRRVALYVRGARSSLPLFDRSYVVEVQSVATGERAEIDLSVDTTDVDVTG